MGKKSGGKVKLRFKVNFQDLLMCWEIKVVVKVVMGNVMTKIQSQLLGLTNGDWWELNLIPKFFFPLLISFSFSFFFFDSFFFLLLLLERKVHLFIYLFLYA